MNTEIINSSFFCNVVKISLYAFKEKKNVDFAWACLRDPRFIDHLLFKTGLLHQGVILTTVFACVVYREMHYLMSAALHAWMLFLYVFSILEVLALTICRLFWIM